MEESAERNSFVRPTVTKSFEGSTVLSNVASEGRKSYNYSQKLKEASVMKSPMRSSINEMTGSGIIKSPYTMNQMPEDNYEHIAPGIDD